MNKTLEYPPAPEWVRDDGRDGGGRHAIFRCHCGNEFRAYFFAVKYGKTHSCGCYRRAWTRAKSLKHGNNRGKEAGGRTPEYRTWANMKHRCECPTGRMWKYYGGRGIKVCDRWQEFPAFLADMGLRPSPQHSIERINTDGNYEPTNCRWATDVEQANNKSNNLRITIEGETKTLSEWARVSGISAGTIITRYKRYGWGPHQAVFAPLRPSWRHRRKLHQTNHTSL